MEAHRAPHARSERDPVTRYIQRIDAEGMQRIHDASMEVLKDVGVAFHEPEAVDIFRRNGCRVDGIKVFLDEGQVAKAVETVPDRFTLHARDSSEDVTIGGDRPVLAPGWGAPFMIDPRGERREATREDYDNFCKLVQTSDVLDINGFLMVMPSDTPPEHAHLDMLLSNMTLCGKAFMGSPSDRQAARDSIEMAAILWGGKERIADHPVMMTSINPVSPLIYSREMAAALIEYARHGQPVEVVDLVMAGTSGPITLAGTAVVQNAENLAGVVLAQLVNPGTPCVYGGSSSATDMRTGALALGSPEQDVLVTIYAQMARFYGIPSKAGGCLTDAFLPDMQAGVESTLSLYTAVSSGIHFILHACGILSSYNAMSYEKFLVDEETCGMVKKIVEPVDVSPDALALGQIKKVGIGGTFITLEETCERCRTEFYTPRLARRSSYDDWKDQGKKAISEVAEDALAERLRGYERPALPPDVERDLRQYVLKRKGA